MLFHRMHPHRPGLLPTSRLPPSTRAGGANLAAGERGPAAASPSGGAWPVTPCLAGLRNPSVSSFLLPRLPCACVDWESELMSSHCHFKCFLWLPSPW